MKINNEGIIAYHMIVFREDGTGTDIIQYDFDGTIESRKPFRDYPKIDYNLETY